MNTDLHENRELRKTKGQGGRTHNRFTDAQKFKLWRALEVLQAELQAEGPSYKQVAERMARELGFPVTAANIEGAVESGVVAWTPRKKVEYQEKVRKAREKRKLREAKEERVDLVLAYLLHSLGTTEEEAILGALNLRDAALAPAVIATPPPVPADAHLASVCKMEATGPAAETVLEAAPEEAPAPPHANGAAFVTSSRLIAVASPHEPPQFADPYFKLALRNPLPLNRDTLPQAPPERTRRMGSYVVAYSVCRDLKAAFWVLVVRHINDHPGEDFRRRRKLKMVLRGKAGKLARRVLDAVGHGDVHESAADDDPHIIYTRRLTNRERAWEGRDF